MEFYAKAFEADVYKRQALLLAVCIIPFVELSKWLQRKNPKFQK